MTGNEDQDNDGVLETYSYSNIYGFLRQFVETNGIGVHNDISSLTRLDNRFNIISNQLDEMLGIYDFERSPLSDLVTKEGIQKMNCILVSHLLILGIENSYNVNGSKSIISVSLFKKKKYKFNPNHLYINISRISGEEIFVQFHVDRLSIQRVIWDERRQPIKLIKSYVRGKFNTDYSEDEYEEVGSLNIYEEGYQKKHIELLQNLGDQYIDN